MKYMIFLLVTFCIQFVLAAPFSGFFVKKGPAYYFTPKSSKLLYKVVVLNSEVEGSLKRLQKGDMISGEGSLDTINKKISITSIDYVGIRRLLGPWSSAKDGTLIFKDFSTLRFIPRLRESLHSAADFSKQATEYRYSISPSEGLEWTLFLSDDKSTTFATLEFSLTKVTIKIFESDSGKVVRTLKLERP